MSANDIIAVSAMISAVAACIAAVATLRGNGRTGRHLHAQDAALVQAGVIEPVVLPADQKGST